MFEDTCPAGRQSTKLGGVSEAMILIAACTFVSSAAGDRSSQFMRQEIRKDLLISRLAPTGPDIAVDELDEI